MSIREHIAPLEELAAIDVDLRRIDDQLAKERTSLEGMRAEVKGLEERLRIDRATSAEMEKTRGELHIELRQMVQQIDRSREKLARSRNERESNAAQRELEELRKLHRDREDEIQRLTSAIDAAHVTIEAADAKRAELVQALEGTVDGITRTIGELETERGVRAKDREGAAARLPASLLRRYDSIRTRRPIAIAKTHDGTCLGCHLSVPPMMFQKMRRQDEFELCPNCRRILYYVPPPSREPSDAS